MQHDMVIGQSMWNIIIMPRKNIFNCTLAFNKHCDTLFCLGVHLHQGHYTQEINFIFRQKDLDHMRYKLILSSFGGQLCKACASWSKEFEVMHQKPFTLGCDLDLGPWAVTLTLDIHAWIICVTHCHLCQVI